MQYFTLFLYFLAFSINWLLLLQLSDLLCLSSVFNKLWIVLESFILEILPKHKINTPLCSSVGAQKHVVAYTYTVINITWKYTEIIKLNYNNANQLIDY